MLCLTRSSLSDCLSSSLSVLGAFDTYSVSGCFMFRVSLGVCVSIVAVNSGARWETPGSGSRMAS